MDRSDAEKLSLLYLKIGADLDQSVAFSQDHDDPENFEKSRKATGKIMADMMLDLMSPLWKRFPDLKPTYLDGEYEIDPATYEPRFYSREESSKKDD